MLRSEWSPAPACFASVGARHAATALRFDGCDKFRRTSSNSVGSSARPLSPHPPAEWAATWDRAIENHSLLSSLLGPRRLCGVELPVALFDAASALVPGNRSADMVRASALACSGQFLLRLAGCQGKNLIVQARRVPAAASWFCGRSAPVRVLPRWSGRLCCRDRGLA